jgi:hypothetical protein
LRPVLIYAPAYHHMSAGVRACHMLCGKLRALGFNAAMRVTHGTWQPSPYDAPPAQVLSQQEVGDSICIFPEYITATTIKTPRAIKWWLQKPTSPLKMSGPTYVWSKGIANKPRLMLDVLDTQLFRPSDRPRPLVAYYVGKGVKEERYIPENAIEITRAFPKERHELANLLGQLDHLVCFDGFSAISAEAALMGTPVLMPTVSKQLRKINEQHEFGIRPEHGFAYTQDEMGVARASVRNFYGYYESIKPMFDQDLLEFAEMLRTKW